MNDGFVGLEETKEYCVVSAGDGLYVRQIGQVDGQRLSEHFLSVWSAIPKSERNLLLRRWRKGAQDGHMRPQIDLTQLKAPHPKLSMAWVQDNGHRITFQAFVVKMMPDEILDALIAYQIAVAKLAMESGGTPTGFLKLHWPKVSVLMKAWGYDSNILFRWKENNEMLVRSYEDMYNGGGGYLEDIDD